MKKLLNKLEYNSPVILTISIVAISIFFIDNILPIELINTLFVYRGGFSLLSLFTLFSYPLGHTSIDHLLGNMTIFLLIGPMLEEKYTSKVILILIIITTVVTAMVEGLIFHSGILGASGIVFMMIVLTSFTNMKDNKIPLTFIFIAILFLIKELYSGIFIENNISELAHLLGATVGILFVLFQKKIRS